MVAPITQHEWEALGEAEAGFAPQGEWESELETEWEAELETGEQFIGGLAKQGWNWLTRPNSPQRKWALDTARSALSGASAWAGERVGSALGAYGASLIPDKEWESELESEAQGEWEGEWETEHEVNPVRKVYLDAMLEHMAHEAALAETEEEAVENFLPLVPMLAGKLLPLAARVGPKLAARVIPQMARSVMRVSPQLSRGISNVTRTLYRNPGTRSLLRAVPSIAQRTMRRVAHQAAMGRPVTAKSALRTLAQQTYRVLSHPGARSRALRRHSGMDKRYHGTTGVPATTSAPSRPPGVCLSCGARAVRPMQGSRLRSRCVCSNCACSY
jgi:hypothetical protein